MAAVAVTNEASTSAVPTQEDKVRYDTLRKELAEQLNKKRATERQLVSVLLLRFCFVFLRGNYFAQGMLIEH